MVNSLSRPALPFPNRQAQANCSNQDSPYLFLFAPPLRSLLTAHNSLQPPQALWHWARMKAALTSHSPCAAHATHCAPALSTHPAADPAPLSLATGTPPRAAAAAVPCAPATSDASMPSGVTSRSISGRSSTT